MPFLVAFPKLTTLLLLLLLQLLLLLNNRQCIQKAEHNQHFEDIAVGET
jgi:hypothetical protein